MKVGLISAYPPAEGGVSSRMYWTAKYLGKKGVEVVVLTDSWSWEENYKEQIDFDELKYLQPKNVSVYQINPLEIKKKKQVGKRGNNETLLFSLGLEIDKKENPDIWYSYYLLPYGLVGYFLSKKTNKPWVLGHASSDLERLGHPDYVNLIDVVREADAVISRSEEMKLITDKVVEPDIQQICSLPEEFNIDRDYNERPIIGCIGKENYSKRWRELLESLEDTKYFRISFFCDKEGRRNLSKIIELKKLDKEIKFNNFVPPWRMPEVYSKIDILYNGEKGFYISKHHPLVPLEGFASGCCNILSDELFEKYENIFDLEDEENVIKVDTLNKDKIKDTFHHLDKKQISEIGRKGKRMFYKKNDYEGYINFLFDIFEDLVR